MTEHEIPDFDHHRKCYDLLGEVWDNHHKVKDRKWQESVRRLLGSSEDPQILFPGDEVELLVDGLRGRFKGHTAIVVGLGDYGNVTVRIPGKFAPEETEEYHGPYLMNQVKLLRRGK